MIFFLFRRPAAPSSGVSGSVTGFSGSVAGSAVSGSRRRVPAGSRVRAQQSSNNLQTQLNLSGGTDKRTRIPPRQRVRNPNLPGTKFSCYSNFQERQFSEILTMSNQNQMIIFRVSSTTAISFRYCSRRRIRSSPICIRQRR